MVIDNKALISAMKAEYKADGYNVAKTGHGDEAVLIIQADTWAVEITWENVPAETLAVIVGHIKTLPAAGEAYTARKDETAAIIFNMVDRVPKITDNEKTPFVHRTPLKYNAMEVWQLDENSVCRLVPARSANMLLEYGRLVRWVDGGLFLEGKASKIHVLPLNHKQTDPERDVCDFLAGKWW